MEGGEKMEIIFDVSQASYAEICTCNEIASCDTNFDD